MTPVKNWIHGFLRRHKARFKPHDWPDSESDAEEAREFMIMWLVAFEGKNVSEGEADIASRLLASTPPHWRRQHIEMVMAKVEDQREILSPATSEASDHKAAREASVTCAYCGGNGLTVAWAANPSNRSPESVPAHCICKHGRWQKQACDVKFPGGFKGILDFADVLDGKVAGWLEHPPGHPELAVGSQMDRPGRLKWREFTGLFQASRR